MKQKPIEQTIRIRNANVAERIRKLKDKGRYKNQNEVIVACVAKGLESLERHFSISDIVTLKEIGKDLTRFNDLLTKLKWASEINFADIFLNIQIIQKVVSRIYSVMEINKETACISSFEQTGDFDALPKGLEQWLEDEREKLRAAR